MLNASCWTILPVITRQQSTSRGSVHSPALPRYQGGSRGEAGTALESETALRPYALVSEFGLWV